MRNALALLALVLCAHRPAPGAAAGPGSDWPGWRGPSGLGVSPEESLPTEWSPEKNIAWKSPVPGTGHSSPVVWGRRVVVTTAVEGAVIPGATAPKHFIGGEEFVHPESVGADRSHALKVLCFDAENGKLLWERTAHEGQVHDNRHGKGSYASPTPATDGERIYAYFGSEGIYAYDLEGGLAWKANVGKISTLGMGVASSPVISGGLVVLQCDEDNGEKSFITALDRKTGREAWKVPRPVSASWSTPLLVGADGRAELITNGSQHTISYDPADGKELWRARGVDSNAIHTPLAGHGLVFVTAGYPAKRTLALRPGASGERDGSRIAWEYGKGTSYVPSSIVLGDHVYLVSDRGSLTCLDPRTGKVQYEGARLPAATTFVASPVAFGAVILLTSEDGETFVVKAGPKHEVIRANPIGEAVFASLALSRGKVFLRSTRHLYCIG
jgi:outer membrane protein assembly factor BamB